MPSPYPPTPPVVDPKKQTVTRDVNAKPTPVAKPRRRR